ncbi:MULTISPECIES: hypothetical protein [Hyphomicrobiales]|uniref:hypothetical protein n=1 Tax=Hyphomicrobiales TaxID=356 RepID=UPI001BCEC077|nr:MULTISPECIES: hypothetical protein [Hyphomicrobiales]MBS7740575.1 hypothetical protein [Chelatococcus sp. HY11]MBX3491298.1 hypothetical protein [Parvibaculum sp.]MBX3544641.1 hypothetical protein [Chelatococcus sp.]MCO5078182.1 hypothetical protein [Chelatococcus sp.]
MDVAIGSPLEKRRTDWFRSLAAEVARLREQSESFDPHLLAGKPEFVSAVYEATTIAMKTHHEEKLAALRNAVLNVGLGAGPSELFRGQFMHYLDRFSVSHIMMLRALHSPDSYGTMAEVTMNFQGKREDGNLQRALAATFPELSEAGLLSQVFSQLRDEGLVSINMGNTNVGMRSGLTGLGEAFLEFISGQDFSDA